MKVGILVNTSPAHGGTFQYAMGVMQCLAQAGSDAMDITVFFDYESSAIVIKRYADPSWRLQKYDRSDGLGIRLCRLAAAYGVESLRKIARGRHRLLKEHNLDLVFCPSASIASWLCDIPYVVAIHDIWHRRPLPGVRRWREPFRDITTRRAVEGARLVLVDSEEGRREVLSAYNVQNQNVQVWETGPAPFVWDANEAGSTDFQIGRPFIFYPGGFQKAKNQEVVLRGLALFNGGRDDKFHAVFSGPLGPYGTEMVQLANDLGIAREVHFLGCVPQEMMAGLYRKAFCLVMASKIGPTNMPIYEAFVLGCPVISSGVGSMPAQVAGAGIIFDPDNPEELARGIERFHSDGSYRERCVQQGRELMKRFDPKDRGARLGCLFSATQVRPHSGC